MDIIKVLAVDDEQHILELLEYNLRENGYEVITVDDGAKAIEIASREKFNLILLDVMLPGMNGIEVCKKLRMELKLDTPIIMLTAKSDEIDKILGLELGADDYVTKPFSVRELLARIKAVTRRYEHKEEASGKTIKVHDIVIDIDKHEVMCGDSLLELTFKEFELLKTFAENRGKVLTRDFLLDAIWGYDYIGETRTVDVHVRYLRKKMGDDESKYIDTIRGVGYKMK